MDDDNIDMAPAPDLAPEPASNPVSAPPSAQAPRARRSIDERQRGRRLFGMLHSTLTQARDAQTPTRHAPSHPDQDRRQDVSSRPSAPEAALTSTSQASARQQDSHEAERRRHDAERASMRQKAQRVQDLAESLVAFEMAHRTARANKRRLSSFLVTHTKKNASNSDALAPRDAMEVTATTAARIVPQVPLCGAVENNAMLTADYEVYYLPRKLLPTQEDALDEQEERVDEDMDKADDDWDQAREAMQKELQETKAELMRHHVAW